MQQAGGESLHCKRYACAVDGSGDIYKQVQQLKATLQTEYRAYQRLKQQPRRDGAVTTPLFLVSEAQHALQSAELRS